MTVHDVVTFASIKRKRQTSPAGLLIEIIGLVCCFFIFPLGILIGLTLMLIGVRLSVAFACTECGNRVEDKSVKICPTCKARLG